MDYCLCRQKEPNSDCQEHVEQNTSGEKENYLTVPEVNSEGSGNMCPQNGETKTLHSDRSLDEERQGSIYSYECNVESGIGFRKDFTAEGASEQLRAFSDKVSRGDLYVGDCETKTHLIERLAGGSFGEVYIGELDSMEKKVAVKVELQGKLNFLLQEGNIYRNLEGGPGIPQVYWYGYHGPQYGVLIMDLLGPTLEHIFTKSRRKLSLKSVLMLADQMLDTLAFIHNKCFVHRDISPSNFVLGGDGNSSRIYLIDFGHAKKYNETFKMVRRRNSGFITMPRAVVGTPRFISVHAHLGHEDGPRDDLESLGYILLYLINGSLPWQGIRAQNMPEKLNKIADIKLNIPLEKLCKDLPAEFSQLFNYIRTIKLYMPLDYDGIKTIFRQLAARHKFSYDHFDWEDKDTERLHNVADAVTIPARLTSTGESPSTTPPSR